nr:hypothetical protein Iba_chr03aCG3340 [Ipomoea batatas]
MMLHKTAIPMRTLLRFVEFRNSLSTAAANSFEEHLQIQFNFSYWTGKFLDLLCLEADEHLNGYAAICNDKFLKTSGN